MHELSIADAIVKTVLKEVEEKKLPAVQRVVVQVGVLSGVVPEALQFGFEDITKDTPLENTELEIEIIPVRGECSQCGQSFEVENYVFSCPACQSGKITVTHGEELQIAYLEVENGSLEDES